MIFIARQLDDDCIMMYFNDSINVKNKSNVNENTSTQLIRQEL